MSTGVAVIIVVGLVAFVLVEKRAADQPSRYAPSDATRHAREALRARAWGDSDYSPADPAPRQLPRPAVSYVASTLGLLCVAAAAFGAILTSGR